MGRSPQSDRRLRNRERLAIPAVALIALLAGAGCVFGGDSQSPVVPLATEVPPAAAGEHGSPSSTAAPPVAAIPSTGTVSVQYSMPFVWPAGGPVTSFMGPEHPDGIDIGLDVPGSLAIRAAAGGSVISAGGSDEDALGLSIVIDHGQGLTTTYGHLSEIVVAEGERVVTGGLIGVGGSTGTSTGVHLHFEVRKDGATVDPLDILPEDPVDLRLAAVDCASSPIVVPAGSNVRVDYGTLLGAAQAITAVRALAFADGPPLEVAVEGRTAVRVLSPINFNGPDGEDEYSLAATVDAGNEIRVLSCVLVLQRRDIPTTFYVRAEPVAEEASAEPTPVPPTPTPNPWPHGPSYTVPASEGSNVGVPDYGLPAGSGVVVQSPSYQPPAHGPTPAVPQ